VKEAAMTVPFKPEGYHSATPYLVIRGAEAAIRFYAQVFGAEEVLRLPMPDGKIGHAEIKIGDSHIMLADESLDMGYPSPMQLGGSPASIMLYLPDCEAVFNRAVANGARINQPMELKFWGDRAGQFTDPFGHRWTVSTHVEDVPPEEMGKRMEAWTAAGGKD
jgi:PhnB protein